MACNLCHETNGHREKCPTLILVDWNTSGARSESVSAWEAFARALFLAYEDDCLSETDQTWKDCMRLCRQYVDDGDPFSAYMILQGWIMNKHEKRA